MLDPIQAKTIGLFNDFTMMQDSLFLAEAARQNDSFNTLFLVLGLGTAMAALIWLFLWLVWWQAPDSDSKASDDDVLETGKKRNAGAALPPGAQSKVESRERTQSAAKPRSSGKAPVSENDDFTKLGISAEVIKALNGRGITRYEQIADWKRADVSGFSSELAPSESGVDFGELPWKAHALARGVDLGNVDPDDPAFGAPFSAPEKVDHEALIAADFAGEEVESNHHLGIVYKKGARSSHRDDLTTIKGVGPDLSKALNESGVICFKQIAAWSDHNVSKFSDRLNCFKNRIERDRWVPQAAAFECAAEDVEEFQTVSVEEAADIFASELASGAVTQDSVYGILYAEKPEVVDDLKKIKGVGKVLEGKLNGIGVYRFKQVGVWTKSSCEEFAKLLTSFKDRIYRDNWIAQAKALHNEKYDDKL